MKQSSINNTPNFRRQRPEAVDNENIAPVISEGSTNQEMTEIDIDRSIGGIS